MISIITTSSPLWHETKRFILAVDSYKKSSGHELELIIVDDLRVISLLELEDLKINGCVIKVVFSKVKGQLGSSIQALGYSTGRLIITMDPDMYGNLLDIDRFVVAHDSGCSLVYGRRISRSDTSFVRRLASRLYNGCIQFFLRLPVHDINTPMLLVSRNIVHEIMRYDGRHGLVKVYFPFILGDRFSEIDIRVDGDLKVSSYSYSLLFFFMIGQVSELLRFMMFRFWGRRDGH